MNDPIVQEVRAARAAIAAEFNYDLPKYLAWIRGLTEARKLASGTDAANETSEKTRGPAAARAIRKRRPVAPKPHAS